MLGEGSWGRTAPTSITNWSYGSERKQEKARGIKEWSGVQVCNGRIETGWKKN